MRLALAAVLLGGAPESARASFSDVSDAAGVDLLGFTYGAAWCDLDGDGHLDLFTGRHFAPPIVYRNAGGGSFEFSSTAGLFEAGDHHGPVLVDFDNDGDADIYITAGAQGGSGGAPAHFYRNDGNLEFVELAAAVGLLDGMGRGRSVSAMDVDRDGAIDLFVAKAHRAGYPNSLYLEDGDGAYVDVAAAAGVADDFGSVGGIWGDFDRDGDADLFVSGEEDELSESRLYRNDGGLSFTDVAPTMLPGLGKVAAAAWGDYDKDGDLDLAVGFGDDALYDAVDGDSDSLSFFMNARDDDNGIDGIDFRILFGNSITIDPYVRGYYYPFEIFIGAAGTNPGVTSPFTITRTEAEGMPDFVPGQSVGLYIWTEGSTWKIRGSTPAAIGYNFGGFIQAPSGFFYSLSSSDFEPYTPGPRGTRLYRNDGDVFVDVSAAMSLDDAANVRTVTWMDYDKDGDLDLHVVAKGDTKDQNGPDVLYRNRGSYFTDETSNQGLAGPVFGLGDGGAIDDYDGDGDLDVAVLSGAPPRMFTLQEHDRLYRNNSNSRGWLRVDLVGTASNRDGLGAWVTCVSSAAGTQSHYVTGNAWRGFQVAVDPYFGLGNDSTVDLLRVEWPSGVVSELTDVPAGDVTVLEIHPALDAPMVARPERLRLGVRPLPARGSVSFLVAGRGAGPGVLEVFDASGRHVVRRELAPGAEELGWDARDDGGRVLAAGVYYGVFRDSNGVATAKAVLLR